jgi:hypothetical protein
MKNLLVVAALVTSSFSFAKSLNVTVSQEKEKINVRFTTTKTFSSMCGMTVTDANLEYGSLLGNEEVKKGKISLEAQTLPHTMCLMAFGPHRGATSFERGYNLPALRKGRYELRINGENYGSLVVADKEVKLEE